MKQFCALIGKFFGIIAIVFLALGLTMPQNFLWVLGKVGGISVLSCLLGVVMFGMGVLLIFSSASAHNTLSCRSWPSACPWPSILTRR